MTRENYYLVLRIVAVIMALLLWYLSVFFSNAGFNFEVDDMKWAGWILAAAITVIELVWTKQGFKPSPTLFVFGLAAYAYGIITNILGIMQAQGKGGDANPISIIFPFVLGFFLEIIPEPLVIWGVLGVSDEGDFIGTLFGLKSNKPEFQIPSPQKPPSGGSPDRIPCGMCGEMIAKQGMREHIMAKHAGKPQASGGKPSLPPFLALKGEIQEGKASNRHSKML